MRRENLIIPVGEREQVSGVMSLPEGAPDKDAVGMILAHGAGNDMNHALIVSLSNGLSEAGHMAIRFNFLYKEKGRKAPDSQGLLVQTWRAVYQLVKDHPLFRVNRIVAAGKSMGGRVASQMVGEGLLPADGPLFLGYPLHPPGKPEKLREAQLDYIKIPMLFFAGTRDPLCGLPHLESVLSKPRTAWDLKLVEGGDHSFPVPKSQGMTEEAVYEAIVKKTIEWIGNGMRPGEGGRI